MWIYQLIPLVIGITTVLAAKPVVIDYSDPTSPASQFRLAYNGPTSVTVSWNTPSNVEFPTVYYGESPYALNSSATGSSTTFDTATTWDNHVTLTGLTPDTKYYYWVSSLGDKKQPLENEFYFNTARSPGDHTPYSVAFIGDLGIVTGNVFDKQIPETFNALLGARNQYEFLWHNGDFGYADDWLWEELTGMYEINFDGGAKTYTNIMNAFYDQFVNVTKNTIYMTGPGNHEADCIEPDLDSITDNFGIYICPDGQRNFTAYQNHFSMPTIQQAQGSYQNMWYSWDHGMVHFIQLNTETDLKDGVIAPDEPGGSGSLDAGPFGTANQQINWLEEDLKAVDRSKTPWIVAAGHRPIYSSVKSSNCDECKDAFENLLVKYNVDLVLASHIHYYERDQPIKNGTADPNGLNNPTSPWYIVNGAAGNFEDHSSPDSSVPEYSVTINDNSYGWSKLTFYNSTHLGQQFISSETNKIIDEAILYKDHGLDW